MEELTYEEHIKAKRDIIISQYTEQITQSLGNIKLNKEDIEDGILTPSFFNRTDVPETKKTILTLLTEKTEEELSKYTI